MILLEDILNLHQFSIQKYGGSDGLRDSGLLESAIARPFQSFGGEDLYPSIFEKAAALGESLIINHPFIDGNKRTGTVAMIAF
jgi:death-on-curing protein